MKRFLIAVSLSLAALVCAFAQDFAAADALHDKEKYADEIALLRQGYSATDPQAAVVYRIIRAMQEVAVAMPAGKDKTARFDETINFGKPLLDTAKGSARDRAKVIYWYAVTMSQKGKAAGVLNSLFMVGDLRGLCDKAIALDPSFGDPYYLKAMIDDAVPDMAGGDKGRMGAEFAKALSCEATNIWYLTDFAMSLKKRNKNASYNAKGDRGVPAGMADIDYAKQLAAKARAAYAALAEPTPGQKDKMDELKAAGL
jgi:hypothetical protein